MNRLLQGDVGSGKTIVAALGMGIVIQNGSQAAFMAPTSILAEQHYASLKRLLVSDEEGAFLHENEIRLLIGDTPANERKEILAGSCRWDSESPGRHARSDRRPCDIQRTSDGGGG